MSDVDPLGNRPADYASSPSGAIRVPAQMIQHPDHPGKTWGDEVREVAAELGHVFPITDAFVDWLLWERTAFPMGGHAIVAAQIRAYFTDPAAADALAEAD